jgi:hypothetical protein
MTAKTKIKIRRSNQTGSTPTTTDLADGELALNTYDGKLFFKKTVGVTTSIVTLEPSTQLTAGTGVSISNNAINIGQAIGTTDTPTFAGATLNGVTAIKESGTGAQNTLTVAGAGTGSLFAVGVSDVPAAGITLKSLTSDSTNPAKLTLSGSSVVLAAGAKQLTFNDSGNLVLPANGDILNSSNVSVLKFPTVKRVTFETPILDQNTFDPSYNPSGEVWNAQATATSSTNNYITVDDASGYVVGHPIVFFGSLGNIVQYKTYYIKTIPDPNTITIAETAGGSTVTMGNDTGFMYACSMSTTNYQTQRAPRLWTNYDSLETTGWDIGSVTFGDTWYDDTSGQMFLYVNQGDGVPTPKVIG